MKGNKRKITKSNIFLKKSFWGTSFIIVMLCIFACTEEDYNEQSNMVMESVLMKATDFVHEEMGTRTVLTPSNSGTLFAWTSNDIVGVYSPSRGLTNFFIDEKSISADGLSANFDGAGFSLQSETKYLAFYPYSASALDKTSVPVSYSGQQMDTNGDFRSLGRYDYMYASGWSDTQNHAQFVFNHIGCVVEIKIKVPETANYTRLRLELEKPSADNHLIKSGTVNLTEALPQIIPSGYTADSIISIRLGENHINVKKDSLLTVYMMMAPQNLDGKNISFRLVDESDKWYKAIVPGKNMRPGYTYHYSINTVNEGFSGQGKGLPDDDLYLEYVSTFTHPSRGEYEWLTYDDGYLYATGLFGIRKIDYSNKELPSLVSESKIGLSSLQKGRAMVIDNDLIYVGVRQNTGGIKETYSPEVSFFFEANIRDFNASAAISNNATVNAFIKQLRLKSMSQSDVDEVLIYKALYEGGIYKNVVQLRKNGKYLGNLYRETYDTQSEALAALPSKYTNSEGDYVELDWSVITKSFNDIKNLVLTTCGEFDSFEAKGSGTFDETGTGGPNRGGYCGRFKTSSSGDNEALVRYNKSGNGGCVSFMMKSQYVPNSEVEVPIFSLRTDNKVSVVLTPDGQGVKFGLKVGNETFSSSSIYNCKEWYNLKVSISSETAQLMIREKECGSWTTLISTKTMLTDVSFDALSIGVVSNANNVELLVDDFFYHPTDLDKASYVNGSLTIVDKRDLSVINKLNLDFKVCGVAKIKDRLVVNFLNGFNVYNVENPKSPKLIYTYRPKVFTEFQGVDVFEAGGRIYALSCIYEQGFAIIDLTDEANIGIVKQMDYSNIIVNGESIQGRCYSFDVVVDYPYAYGTIASTTANCNTDKDHRGIVTIDLRDISNPAMNFTEIPKARLSRFTQGDQTPTHITKCGNHVIVNNCEFGTEIFNIGIDGRATYRQGLNMPNTSSSNAVYATKEGLLFVGDNSINGTLRNIYLFKGLR